jgi:hypothetical protein
MDHAPKSKDDESTDSRETKVSKQILQPTESLPQSSRSEMRTVDLSAESITQGFGNYFCQIQWPIFECSNFFT